MPNRNIYLLSLPVMHGLVYGSALMKQLIGYGRQLGLTVVATDGTAEENDKAIKTYDPVVFYSVGHGNCVVHTVECMTPYISTVGECRFTFLGKVYEFRSDKYMRLDMFRGRHVHLQSCVTGMILGKDLVRKGGARSFIGYTMPFIYGVRDRMDTPRPSPGTPPTHKADYYSFIACDVAGEYTIMGGGTVLDAVNTMRRWFNYYIMKYYTDWKDWPIATGARLALLHDMEHLVAYGDLYWRPCAVTGPTVLTSAVTPLGMIFLGASIFLLSRFHSKA